MIVHYIEYSLSYIVLKISVQLLLQIGVLYSYIIRVLVRISVLYSYTIARSEWRYCLIIT